MIEAFIQNKIDKSALIVVLKQKLKIERSIFEKKESSMDDLEKAQYELKLTKMEHLIVSIQEENSPVLDIKYDKVVNEFLGWEHDKTIEILNFLLAEFFAHSYHHGKWDNDFITDIVFETTRLTNFIQALNTIKSNK